MTKSTKFTWCEKINGVYFRGFGATLEEAKADCRIKALQNFWHF